MKDLRYALRQLAKLLAFGVGTTTAIFSLYHAVLLMTMRQEVDANVFLDRLVAILSTAFAALATLLAAIGFYGVLAYNVAPGVLAAAAAVLSAAVVGAGLVPAVRASRVQPMEALRYE